MSEHGTGGQTAIHDATGAHDEMDLATELLDMINNEVSLDQSYVVELDTDLLLTGLVDSLGVVMIVGWLEDRLGIEIDPADIVLDHFQTPNQMLAYLEGRR